MQAADLERGDLDELRSQVAALAGSLQAEAARLERLSRASAEITEGATVQAVLASATRWSREVVGARRAESRLVPVDGDAPPLVARSDWDDQRSGPEERHGQPVPGARLAMPLVGRDGRELGLIEVFDKLEAADFSDQDRAALAQVASLAVAEVERLRQLEEARTALEQLQRHHELTSTITENATSALFLMDDRGHPTYQNAAARAMFGYELDEIAGRPLHEAIHHRRPDGSSYPIEECPIDRALPEQRWVEPYEDLFVRRDGTFVPVAAAASPILRDGVPVGTVVEVRDLTGEKAALAELDRQHELTRAITDNAVSALIFLDQQGHPTYVNQAWVSMTGFGLDEMRHRTAHEVVHHTRPDGSPFPIQDCPIDRALPERRWVQPYEDVFIRKDGTFFPVRVAASPLLEEGRPVGTVVEVADITEERRIHADRTAAEERLRFMVEASEALGRTFHYVDAFQEVADRAVPTLCDYCVVDVVEGGVLRRVAVAHATDAAFAARISPFVPSPDLVEHPINVAWRSARPVVVDHRQRCWLDALTTSPEHRAVLDDVGVSAVMAVPIATAREVVGVLTLARTGGASFGSGVLETAMDLARRGAAAVDAARLFERVEFQSSLLEAQGDASIDGLLVVGSTGDIAWHNRRFREMWSLSAEVLAEGDDAALRAAARVVSEPVAFRRRVQEIYDREAVAHDELRFRDGRTIERYGAPLRGRGGVRYGYFWSFRDITQRKRTEERLAELYRRERDASHRLQAGLLATTPPAVEDVVISSAYRAGTAALEVGGDWFDTFRLRNGRVVFVVGDVAGHGVEAAAAMGQLRGALRALAGTGEPGEVLEGMNALLSNTGRSPLTTLAYIEFDPATGDLRYACAGHLPPLVISPSGRSRYLWGARSTPLGCQPDTRYLEAQETLAPGETLVLYTDGLVERRQESLDLGLTRLARTLNLAPTSSPALAEEICDRLGHDEQNDDVCVLTAHRLDGGAFGHVFTAGRGALSDLRRRFDTWLAERDVDPAVRSDVVLAVHEAVANAVEHGHHYDGVGTVAVRADLTAATVTVTVSDDGGWRAPTPRPERGRGINMMRLLVDEVTVDGDDQGTMVTLTRAAPATRPGPGPAGDGWPAHAS